MSQAQPLHTKYRPQTLDEVIGQGAAVKALSTVLKRNESQAYLFAGPSGVGKTTLARIAAGELGCTGMAIREINAARFTGVDDMRAVQEMLQYSPFGKSKARSIIIDECHRLSRNAWDSLLKAIEEPPPDAYWFFCTTEMTKVPETIKTRCITLSLKPVPDQDIEELIVWVAEQEKIKLAQGIATVICKEAHGSPRQALVYLAMCRSASDRKEAAALIYSAQESDVTIEIARLLCQQTKSWAKAMALVNKIDGESPESIRIVCCNYFATAAKGAKTEREACFFLGLLDNFSHPYTQAEGLAPLIISIGRCLFAS